MSGVARSQSPLTEPPSVSVADTDHAWRMLGLVVEWIKHAEAKAAGLLASAGIIAGVLYNLVSGRHHPGVALTGCAIACAVFTLLTAVCAVIALRPRLHVCGALPQSLLYFGQIAGSNQGRTRYVAAFRALAHDQDAMLGEIADQIWATAGVAWQKYRWGNRGLQALMLAIVCLGAAAGLALTGGR